MKKKRGYPVLLCISLFMVSSLSFPKMLTVDPAGVLAQDNMYQNVFDADAAVIGVYGNLMNLAESYVILNELRADLMTTTPNSDEFLRQLNEHEVSGDNPYINPRPYYEVILNCNDVLAHFDLMLQEKKRQAIVGTMLVMAFVWLQID